MSSSQRHSDATGSLTLTQLEQAGYGQYAQHAHFDKRYLGPESTLPEELEVDTGEDALGGLGLSQTLGYEAWLH